MNLINTCRNISLHSEEILFNWQQEILYRFAIDWRCPFLDAIASPSTYTYPSQWVGQSVGDSFRSGDSYRISELCEFVAPDQVQYGYLFYCWSQYDHSNPLLTRHSNPLLTHHSNHLLTSGKTRKSPSSLWGLKKCCPFTLKKISLNLKVRDENENFLL